MSEWSVVVVAYGLTWVVIGAYAVHLRVRLGRAEKVMIEAADTPPEVR